MNKGNVFKVHVQFNISAAQVTKLARSKDFWFYLLISHFQYYNTRDKIVIVLNLVLFNSYS